MNLFTRESLREASGICQGIKTCLRDEEDGDEDDDGDEDADGDDNGGGGWGFTDSSDVVDMRSVVNGDGPRALDKTLTQTCKSQSVGGWVC